MIMSLKQKKIIFKPTIKIEPQHVHPITCHSHGYHVKILGYHVTKRRKCLFLVHLPVILMSTNFIFISLRKFNLAVESPAVFQQDSILFRH